MVRVPSRASRGLRWGALSLIAAMATLAITTDPADARSRRKRYVKKYHHAKIYKPKTYEQITSSSRYAAYRGRRQDRQGAARSQRRQPAASGVADQDHDALHAVRAARSRQDQAQHADGGVGGSRIAGADQARRAAGPDARGRGRDQGAGHQVGQRRRGGRRRGAGRQRRSVRPADDAQGARARHEPHDLPQRLRPARRRAGHHGARTGHARHRDPGALPALLPLFLVVELQLSRPRDAQPQQAARPRARRRWHQDRLHPRFGFQPGFVGAPQRPPYRGGGARRLVRRAARRAHAQR